MLTQRAIFLACSRPSSNSVRQAFSSRFPYRWVIAAYTDSDTFLSFSSWVVLKKSLGRASYDDIRANTEPDKLVKDLQPNPASQLLKPPLMARRKRSNSTQPIAAGRKQKSFSTTLTINCQTSKLKPSTSTSARLRTSGPKAKPQATHTCTLTVTTSNVSAAGMGEGGLSPLFCGFR